MNTEKQPLLSHDSENEPSHTNPPRTDLGNTSDALVEAQHNDSGNGK